MKYVRLKDEFGLRGWDKLPYGIVNFKTGTTTFLNREQFEAIELCVGGIELSSLQSSLLAGYKNSIQEGLERGFLEKCAEPHPQCGLNPYQEYKKANCRYLNSIQWSITGKCNLKCKHCYVNAPNNLYEDLSLENCLKVINQFEEANIAAVSITGGEPLVRKDFWAIIDAILEKKIAVNSLFTNGLLVDNHFLEECKKRKLNWNFNLSFDGVNCHDWLRGIPGTEAKTLQAIKRIREYGYQVVVSTAIHSGNIKSLRETYDLLKTLGLNSWKVSTITDTGNWKNEADKKNIEIKDLYEAYLELIAAYRKEHMPMTLMLGGFYLNEQGCEKWRCAFEKFDGTEKALNAPVCGPCRTNLYLMPDGRLMPCIPMSGSAIEEQAPDILVTPLVEILHESSALFSLINTRLRKIYSENPVCGACEFFLKCGGGCRALALQEENNIYGIDRRACFFWKNGYYEKLRQAIANSIIL